MIGLANIAVLYGQLGMVLNSRYQASAAFRIKLDRVKAECEYYKVPWDLQNRVIAYYDYLWVNQVSSLVKDENTSTAKPTYCGAAAIRRQNNAHE
tara:strand:- start:710 stop:994 length:285 start_codon:yes stop_codon:yes gene_type:complete